MDLALFLTCLVSSELGSAALQNTWSRESASSRICLRVLVSASSLLTEPEPEGWNTQNTSCSWSAAQDHPTCGMFWFWTHLMKAELLWGAQGIKSHLHLAEKSAALQDLLLQSFKVFNVADHMAAVTVGKGTVWSSALQCHGCLKRKQEI